MKHWRLVYLAIPLTIFVFLGIMCVNGAKSPELCEGVGRAAAVYMTAASADEARTGLPHYTEGQSPVPEWWDPDEDMAVEWSDNTSDNARLSDSNTQRVIDVGCPDYNTETVIFGWNGHRAESYELELLARCFYLEFWGSSETCCEAGCDAMLNLWDSGLYGTTLGASLSHYDEDYGWTYSVYPDVWNTEYDPDGLDWCREFTMNRFENGPEWDAMYFQLYGFHDPEWAVPLYEIDGVYFSVGK